MSITVSVLFDPLEETGFYNDDGFMHRAEDNLFGKCDGIACIANFKGRLSLIVFLWESVGNESRRIVADYFFNLKAVKSVSITSD